MSLFSCHLIDLLIGSSGDIFKVRWRGLDCAAKSLQKINVKNKRTIRDLGKEIQIMSTIRHPNLILFLGKLSLRFVDKVGDRLVVVLAFHFTVSRLFG